MPNRLFWLLLACAGSGACEVADLPPLAADVTRADSNDTRDADAATETRAETAEPDSEADSAAEVEPEVEPDAETEVDDTEAEVDDDVDQDVSAPADGLDEVEVEADTDDGETVDDVSGEVTEPDAAACVSTILTNPAEGQTHVPVCSAVTYGANPPTSGNHYGNWPEWKTYTTPVPRGFLVHGLEHGGIVFAYNCPDGCQAELDALHAMLAARPADARCPLGLTNQFIVTPDPLLDVRFAASAWNVSLEADCMDVAAMSAFIDAHYDQGPEKVCVQGADVTNPAVPATYCPPACSWCDPPTF